MEVGIDEAIKYFFSSPSFDLIYYEAIANSLDAGATEIDITIELPTFSEPKDLKISIKDNGSGFSDKNFRQFSTLLKHKDMQHKGLGRLVYLHYFDQVVVQSTFDTGVRKFVFNKDFKGESEVQPIRENIQKETILKFSGFCNEKLKTYDNVRCSSVKQHIIETFLPRLYHLQQNGVPFNIAISTITNEENTENNFYSDTSFITEKDLPELTKVSLDHSDLSFFCESFDMLYHIDQNTPGNLVTEICVDGRGIDVQILNKKEIPEDISGVFFLQSDYFDSKASDSRQSLNLDEYDERIVKQKFLEAIGEILDRELPMMKEINHKTIEKLSKQFPHLAGYFDEKTIGLLEENQTLEHAQAIFFKDQKEILKAEKLSDSQYNKSLLQATRTLAEYILYRNIIIKKLKEIDGNEKESRIHNLIVPMQSQIAKDNPFWEQLYTNNAWLIDDKFMGYHYILSDENMNLLLEKISVNEGKNSGDLRPDIAIVFSENIDSCNHPVDVVVIELKKKNLDYLRNMTVYDQLKQRARRLLAYYQTKIQRMWFIGIVDFDDEIRVELDESWHPLYSTGEIYCKPEELFPIDENKQKIGNTKYPVNMTLMSFDALWKDAETRNSSFLEVLRQSIKKSSQKS